MQEPRIILCRHAESLEDVDSSVYNVLNDLEIPLTKKGLEQAHNFGLVLAQLLRDSSHVQFYTSPGVRNVQTLKVVIPKLPDDLNVEVEIEPLIVKQDWGLITTENKAVIEQERYKTGVLRYTFPTGESASSMMSRLDSFRKKVFKLQKDTGRDVVVFSHGFEFRVLLKLILGWSEDLFESFSNLRNCEYRILTRGKDGSYHLNKDLRKHGFPVTRLQE